MTTFNSSGAFFIDSLQGPDNGSPHDLNSGLSGLSLSSTIPQGSLKHEIGSMSPGSSALDGSFSGFLQQAPSTPTFHQQNRPQLARHHSLDINDPRRMGAINIGPFPTTTNSPNVALGSPQPPLGDFLHAPNMNNSPANQGGFVPLDNFNPGLNNFATRGLLDPAPISPVKPIGNEIGRERSYSTPESSYNQFPRGAMSSPASASTNQMSSLYEDKPLLSPSGIDWQNSRPPRHGHGSIASMASIKDSNPNILLPRPGMIRHAVSDGSFNSHQQQLGGASPSFEASLQKVQLNSTTPFGSLMGADSNPNQGPPIQPQMHRDSHQMPHGMPHQHERFMNNPQGFMNNAPHGLGHNNFVQQEQFLIHQGPPPNFAHHNPTGSGHFLVNERGEIIGHASHMVQQGMPQPGQNFTQTRQRAMSHAGVPSTSPFQLQGQGNFAQHLPPFPPFNDGANQHKSLAVGQMQMGSIGDGRMQHQRQSIEPEINPTLLQVQISDESVSSRQSQPRVDSDLSQTNSSGVDEREEEPTKVVAPVAGQSQSYASKLMTAPRPPPVEKVTAQPATAGANISKAGQKMIYTVKFKRSQRAFKLGERVTREVKIGCYVKVEADRGEDLGIVISIVPVEKYLASNRTKSASDDEEQPVPSQITSIGDIRRIMRPATNDEITLLEVKKEEEDELLKICTTKARQRGLPMTVVDAEYQFDRNKLTFFFEAEGRIDFRELVRDLFSIYKTRIWMQQVNKDECEGKAQ